MEINNLSQNQPIANFSNLAPKTKKNTFSIVAIILVLGITAGFFLSRISPSNGSSTSLIDSIGNKDVISSTDHLESKDQVEVGKTYGNTSKNYSDKATGKVEAGSINGEGTHILVRDGGLSQRVSLTSSNIDLDLFVGHKVEVKGETNSSNKTGWLLDVGNIKVIE
jgi:hypothetical protein